MVIRGNSRGNARQLGHYLLQQKDNEAIRIFEVDGMNEAEADDLHRALFAMGISEELSKSKKGLYHAQINPAPGEYMDDERWRQAADMLGQELKLENQRRAIVLHTKKGRTHAHVVWERYDYDKGKMVSDSFSRLAQDRARKDMEREFNHAPTPHRNAHRPELKAALLTLWNQTGTGAQFVTACKQNNYLIAAGSGRSPFVVVDENGRSYDLARQLKGVKLKDVRQRLRNEALPGEKDAITIARNAQNRAIDKDSDGKGKQNAALKPKPHMMSEYNENKADMTGNKGQSPQENKQSAKEQFTESKEGITGQKPEKSTQEKFGENKEDLSPEQQKQQERERRKAEFEKEWNAMQSKKEKEKDKDHGPEMR
jgi:hypothetical protein